MRWKRNWVGLITNKTLKKKGQDTEKKINELED